MADIVTSKIWVDGEKGVTAAKMNQVISGSVIQPAFYTAKPTASSLVAGDKLLALKAGSYVQSDFQTVIDSVGAALSSDTEIWNVRLRSYNSVGNPNMEVDQVNCGNVRPVTSGVSGWIDRWLLSASTATIGVSSQQLAENVAVPGTSYFITQKFHRTKVTAAAASLAATDYVALNQAVEGPQLRELLGDVHSVSLLVRSNVPSLKFGLYLQDPAQAHVLGKLCTLGAANTWTLITLPNLPLWTASGNFSLTPGTLGYFLGFTLAAGSTYTLSANDTWQTSPAFGAVGQSNFAAAINNTFDVAFVQHEPGPACSQLMDLPFERNLESCMRHFQKTYGYNTLPGTGGGVNGYLNGIVTTVTTAYVAGFAGFQRPMAKTPTIGIYDSNNGAVNSVFNNSAGTHLPILAAPVSEKSLMYIQLNAASTPGHWISLHYTAGTGW